MSEKDGKRVLSPAEKAEADSLTNKQWPRYHRRPDGKPPMIVRFR